MQDKQAKLNTPACYKWIKTLAMSQAVNPPTPTERRRPEAPAVEIKISIINESGSL